MDFLVDGSRADEKFRIEQTRGVEQAPCCTDAGSQGSAVARLIWFRVGRQFGDGLSGNLELIESIKGTGTRTDAHTNRCFSRYGRAMRAANVLIGPNSHFRPHRGGRLDGWRWEVGFWPNMSHFRIFSYIYVLYTTYT